MGTERIVLKRTGDQWYTVESEGFDGSMPVLHYLARDRKRRQHHVRVAGLRPYFCIRQDEFLERHDEIEDDSRVLRVDPFEEDDSAVRGVTDERLTRVVCELPRHLRDLRDVFDESWEADVSFPDRFTIDKGIETTFAVPTTDRVLSPDEVESVEPDEHPSVAEVRPRIVSFDIEVLRDDTGVAVVSEKGTRLADQPITAIAAHDSYADTYGLWILAHQDWDDGSVPHPDALSEDGKVVEAMACFETDRALLADFIEWLSDRCTDVLTAWNGNGFDVPYLVNRCFTRDLYSVKDLSPTGDVEKMHGEGKWLNSDLKGIVCVDMLDAFSKTSRHELDSYRLEVVADEVLDIPKLDVDEQAAWVNDPERFCEYVLRDTEAVVEINNERGIL